MTKTKPLRHQDHWEKLTSHLDFHFHTFIHIYFFEMWEKKIPSKQRNSQVSLHGVSPICSNKWRPFSTSKEVPPGPAGPCFLGSFGSGACSPKREEELSTSRLQHTVPMVCRQTPWRRDFFEPTFGFPPPTEGVSETLGEVPVLVATFAQKETPIGGRVGVWFVCSLLLLPPFFCWWFQKF